MSNGATWRALACIGLPAALALAGCQGSAPHVGAHQQPLTSDPPPPREIHVQRAWVDGCDISVIADDDYAQGFNLAQVNVTYEVSANQESVYLVFTGDDNTGASDAQDGGGAIQIGQPSAPPWREVVALRRTGHDDGTLKLNNFKYGGTVINATFKDAWAGTKNIASFGTPNNNTEAPIVQLRSFTSNRATLHVEYRGVTVEFVLEPPP